MVDQDDLLLRDLVHLPQNVESFASHDHHKRTERTNLLENFLLLLVERFPEHCVEGGHRGLLQITQQGEQMRPMLAPVDAEFVLDRHHLGGRHVQVVGRLPVVRLVLLTDLETHLGTVGVTFGRVGDSHNAKRPIRTQALFTLLGNRRRQVVRERCDPASTGYVATHKTDIQIVQLLRSAHFPLRGFWSSHSLSKLPM